MGYAISYVSTASESLTEDLVKNLLTFTEVENNSKNITGILLFSGGNFFQVIEGKKSVILNLFEKIKNDNRHFNIIKIFENKIQHEPMSAYSCGFITERNKHDPILYQFYLNHLNVLGKKPFQTTKSVWKAFIR